MALGLGVRSSQAIAAEASAGSVPACASNSVAAETASPARAIDDGPHQRRSSIRTVANPNVSPAVATGLLHRGSSASLPRLHPGSPGAVDGAIDQDAGFADRGDAEGVADTGTKSKNSSR